MTNEVGGQNNFRIKTDFDLAEMGTPREGTRARGAPPALSRQCVRPIGIIDWN
jgi:hypothetical protein